MAIDLKKTFWPPLTTAQSAATAVKHAASWAFVSAALTGTIALSAMFYGPVWGFDGWEIVDALFLALIGWRVSRFSQPWAVMSVAYWTFGTSLKVLHPQAGLSPVGALSILMLLGFINGLRGIRAYKRLTVRPEPSRESNAAEGTVRLSILPPDLLG